MKNFYKLHFYKPHKNKTFYKLLLSYIVVLLIPIIIIGYIYYTKAIFIIDKNTEDKYRTMAEKTIKRVDERIRAIKDINVKIATSSWIDKLKTYENNESEKIDIFLLEDVIKELNDYISMNEIIDEIALVIPKNDLVISSYGKNNIETYFRYNVFRKEFVSKFNESIQKYTFYKVFPVENVKNTISNNIKLIPIVQSTETTSKMPFASLLILVKENSLKSLIDKAVINNECKLSLVWDNGYTFGDIDTNKFSDIEIIKNTNDMNKEPIWDGENYIYAIRSTIAPWTYVYQIPKNVMLYDGKNISMYIIISTVLVFIIGFLISTFFTFKNYNPLHRLFIAVKKQIGTSKHREKTSEFKIIEEYVNRICKENKLSKEKLVRYEPVIRANKLMKLVKGYFTSDEKAKEILYEVGFENNENLLFAVIVIEVLKKNSDNQGDDHRTGTYENFRVISILEQWFEINGISAQVFENDKERIASVLALRDNKFSILKMTHEIRKHIKKETEDEIYAGCGELVKKASDINKSFEKAEKMLDCIVFSEDNSDINIKNYMEENDMFYFYPPDWEVHIMNSLKAGNLKAARQVIKEIKYENCINRKLSFSVLRRLLFTLIETLMKTMDELNIADVSYEEEFEKIIACKKEVDIWQYIDEKCFDICKKINNKRMNMNSLLKKNIVSYVKYNYYNSSISLKELSEKFNIPLSSVSKIFKEVAGVNFLEFVNRKRIEKAKDYLRKTDKQICTISTIVGYESDKTFRRIFKKYEGVSPVNYRLSFMK